MSAEVTDADRATALACGNWTPFAYEYLDADTRWLVDNIAQALADQRAAADDGHEWCCPSCGATTRARMADRDDDGLRARVEALADKCEAEGRSDLMAGFGVGLLSIARNLRAVLDQPTTAAPCPARHTVTGDGGVPAQWSCQVLGEHDEHQDSTGRGWA